MRYQGFHYFCRHFGLRCVSSVVIPAFSFLSMCSTPPAQAQVLNPSENFIQLSPVFHPALLQGVTIHPDNPLALDFIVDSGDSGLSGDELKAETQTLIKYFLALLS